MSIEKEQISDSDILLRRVQYLHPNFIKPDGTPASSSFSLKKDEDGLSVDIERLTTFEKSIQDDSKFRLFSLEAEYTKSLGLDNVHDPKEDNYAHALIKGNVSKSIARKLAAKSKRILYPK